MATVKFISEKECQLFIDMELVGIVETNKMLKVALESGSYLVEVKDAKGSNLRKYELKINPNDNQILQDLTAGNDDIEEVLESLRNDSSLRFYNQRAVFAYNGKYGYINSQYKIIIPPIYSYADNFISPKAFVRRLFPDGEKATIIDTDGSICLGKWYDYFGCNDKQVLLRSGKTFFVYNREDYSIIREYKDAGYDNKSKLIPVHQEIGIDDYYGYIDEAGGEIIPFIYDFAWNFEENGFAKVKRFGTIHAVDSNGTVFYDMQGALKDGKSISRKRESWDEPGEGDIVEVYHATKLSKEESNVRGFSPDGMYYPVKEDDIWGIGIYDFEGDENSLDEDGEYTEFNLVPNNKIVFDPCDRIIYYDEQYMIYRKDGICTLKYEGKEYNFQADEIEMNFRQRHTWQGYYDECEIFNVIIKRNKKYGIAELDGRIILPIEYDLILTTEAREKNISGYVGIIWKNNKCSLVNMRNGKILEPFKYEEIIVNDSRCDSWIMSSTYLVKENGKYGCIDYERKAILPTEYDRIDYKLECDDNGYHYKILLYKNGKIGTYEFCNYREMYSGAHEIELEFKVEPEYDECVFLKNGGSVNSFIGMSYIAVRKGDKWGILDNTPARATYHPVDETYWYNNPNLKDLEFKYCSLNELVEDADEEFRRRYKKYERPHMIHELGGSVIVSEFLDDEDNKKNE